MRLLLDTHALIWWWLDDPSLSPPARAAMAAGDHQIFVSAVAAIEIGIKVRRGKLPALREAIDDFDAAIDKDGFAPLSITTRHARDAGMLPGEHRDPFDRLIAAQGLLEDMTIVTRDPEFAAFGCKVLW